MHSHGDEERRRVVRRVVCDPEMVRANKQAPVAAQPGRKSLELGCTWSLQPVHGLHHGPGIELQQPVGGTADLAALDADVPVRDRCVTTAVPEKEILVMRW